MCKSEKIVEELVKEGLIDKLCDRIRAAKIIKAHLAETHNEAVQATVMASNKKHFQPPAFND
jgi:hypothetical protein